jgi:hypothetical protein
VLVANEVPSDHRVFSTAVKGLTAASADHPGGRRVGSRVLVQSAGDKRRQPAGPSFPERLKGVDDCCVSSERDRG